VTVSEPHPIPNSKTTTPRKTAAALAGGLDVLVCGLPMTVVGLLFCLLNGTLDLLNWLATPLGALVILWGAMRLARSGWGGMEFVRSALWCVGLAMTILALSPFLFWWRQMPKNFYFTLNVLLFVAALTALVFAVNRLCAQVNHHISAPGGVNESKSVVWLIFVAWVLPLCVVTGFIVRASVEYGEPMGWVLRKSLGDLNIGFSRWLVVGSALAPIMFTCIALIATRRRLLAWATQPPFTENETDLSDNETHPQKNPLQTAKEQR
jgi:hypothetical protein